MFEKEAEARVRDYIIKSRDCLMQPCKTLEDCKDKELEFDEVVKLVKEGAEFGYKLAHEEIDYLNKHWRSEEERKANEWHYVKDGLPEELHDVLCFVIHNEHRYVLQGYLREGRWVLSPLETYLNNDDIIAWKEIVLPKEE